VPLGAVVSTQLGNTGVMYVERRGENSRQRLGIIGNMLTHDDMSSVVARQRRPSQQPVTVSTNQRSNDVWFEPRQRSRNNEHHQQGDERCFVHYVPPVYSRPVHTTSARHPSQFTTDHRDLQSDSGQTVDL